MSGIESMVRYPEVDVPLMALMFSPSDPILGLAVLDLTDIFNNSSQKTRNYPLVGGIGWGIGKPKPSSAKIKY